MREINITVENERVKGDGVCVGAAGSGRDVFIRARFGESWEGCDALSAQWTDARGGKSVIEISPFAREVVFAVSFAAKKYAGDAYLTLKGGKLAPGGDALLSATLSASARFTVEESLWDRESESADMPDPTVAEQLTGRMTEVENDLSAHAARTDNPHSVTKSQVGLGNADNTSDLNKPVSTAAQTALDLKLDKAGGTIEGTVVIKKTSGDMLVLNRTDTATGIVNINAESGAKLTLSVDDGDVTVRGIQTPTEDNDASNKEYVDDQRDAAKGYAETQAAEAESNAKSYADGVGTSTLSSAKSYADDKKTEAISAAASDAASKVSTHNSANDAHSTLFAAKAPLANPTFTGTVTAPSIAAENISIDASGSAGSTVEIGESNVKLSASDIAFSVGNGDADGIPYGISANGNKIHGVGTPSADADAANKGYIDAAILNVIPKKSVSGAALLITDGADALPFISLKSKINAFQSGSGTPSAGNPRPFNGYNTASVWKAAKNLFDQNAIFDVSGITHSGDEWYGTANSWATNSIRNTLADIVRTAQKSEAQQFAISFKAYNSGSTLTGTGLLLRVVYDDNNTTINAVSIPNNTTSYTQFSCVTEAGRKIRGASISYSAGGGNVWHIKDFQVEAANAASAFQAFDGAAYSQALGDTYYGGVYDWLTGEFTQTHGYIASYDGETINEPWASSIDEYVAGTAPSEGAEVVYPLTAPVTSTIGTTQTISTLYGKNTVIANSGDVEAAYRRDISRALDALEA